MSRARNCDVLPDTLRHRCHRQGRWQLMSPILQTTWCTRSPTRLSCGNLGVSRGGWVCRVRDWFMPSSQDALATPGVDTQACIARIAAEVGRGPSACLCLAMAQCSHTIADARRCRRACSRGHDDGQSNARQPDLRACTMLATLMHATCIPDYSHTCIHPCMGGN